MLALQASLYRGRDIINPTYVLEELQKFALNLTVPFPHDAMDDNGILVRFRGVDGELYEIVCNCGLTLKLFREDEPLMHWRQFTDVNTDDAQYYGMNPESVLWKEWNGNFHVFHAVLVKLGVFDDLTKQYKRG